MHYSRHLKSAHYLPVLGLSMALMMVRVLVFAKVLSVNQFAYLNLALIISTLITTLVCLGFFTDLQRKLPVDLQSGEPITGSARLAVTAVGAVIVASAAFIVVSGISAFGYFPFHLAVTGVFHGLANQLFLIATTESRSSRETMRYSFQSLLRSVLILLLAVPVALATGSAIAGLLTEAFIALFAALAISHRIYRKYLLSPPVLVTAAKAIALKTNWRSMLALVLATFAIAASANADRWLAAKYLPATDFAHYTFAAIAMVLAYSTQTMLNAAIYPAIAGRMATSPRLALRLAAIMSISILAGSLIAALPTIFVAIWLVGKYYPKYQDSIPLIAPLAVAGVFRISDFWTSYIIISGRENLALAINLIALVAPVLCWLAVGSPSTISIAYLTVGISVCSFALSMIGSFYARHDQIRR